MILSLQIFIQVHSKAGEQDITVCKWQNYIGKDGLNARIVPKLPIHRGSAGEFFFKSLSTTTFGIARKTVFAVKIPNETEASEFHMWWLHFNGQMKAWHQAGEKAAENRDTVLIESFPEFPSNDVEGVISIYKEVFDESKFNGGNNTKRKQALVSPRNVSGVGKQQFRFEEFITSPEARPPPAQRSKSFDHDPVPLPKDFNEAKDIISHDRLIFKSELTAGLLVCLRKNNVSLEKYEFQINSDSTDPHHRKFAARITGVPQYMCGLLWCAADYAARTSQVSAIRAEQQHIDSAASCMSEEAVQNDVVVHCYSIPTIKICPIGMNQDLERLTFQQLCDEPTQRFVRHNGRKLANMPVGEGIEVNSDSDDEDEEVLVDDCDFVVMSQEINWH